MTSIVSCRFPVFFGAALGRFRGILLSKDASQAVPQNIPTLVLWQVPEDQVGAWFASSGDNFVTVPLGVRRVRMSAGVNWASGAGTFKDTGFLKNGVSVPGLGFPRHVAGETRHAVTSPVIEVVPGDTLSVVVEHNMGSSINLLTDDATYFGVEAVW